MIKNNHMKPFKILLQAAYEMVLCKSPMCALERAHMHSIQQFNMDINSIYPAFGKMHLSAYHNDIIISIASPCTHTHTQTPLFTAKETTNEKSKSIYETVFSNFGVQ